MIRAALVGAALATGEGCGNAPAMKASGDGARGSTAPVTRAALEAFTFRQFHMAMPVEVTVFADSRERAEAAGRAAFAAVARVDELMNDYRPTSEISRVSAAAGSGPVTVSAELMTVLLAAKDVWDRTGGAFDPTAGPVVALWREAAKTGTMPAAGAIEASLRLVGMEKVRLDPGARTVELTLPGMRLDVGGIAKGYACDLASAAIREQGVAISLVSAGGDMVLGDPPPGTDGWPIDVPGEDSPRTLANVALSISGDTARFTVIDGVRYSHIVDPRTGIGVTTRQMALVIAPSGLVSDPLATAGCIMERDDFLLLVERTPSVRAEVFRAPAQD